MVVHKIQQIFFGMLLVVQLLLFTHTQAGAEEKGEINSFIKNFQSTDSIELTDVTTRLQPLKSFKRGESVRYESLRALFSRQQRVCLGTNLSTRTGFDQIFSRFSGKSTLQSPEVFSSPCALIALHAMSPTSLEAKLFEQSHGKRKIPGLQISVVLQDLYYQLPITNFSEYYAPDLNARVAGFTHGRLMLDLSTNVRVAEQFEYNDLLEWSEHNSLSKNDQTDRAIPLTNHAHPSGSTYLISTHPDFALEFLDFRRQASVLTFFLWKSEPKPQAAPDFVYQLVVRPRK